MTNIKVLANLLIIIPTLIGLSTIKIINKQYLLFLWFLIAGTLNEIIFIIFKSTIAGQFYAIAESQLMLALLFAWDKNRYIFNERVITHIVFLIFSFIDIHCIVNHIYETRWMHLTLLGVLSFYAIAIINQLLSKDEKSKSTISKLFILIPFVVFNIYYIILKILMGLLFTKTNQQLFINLYEVVIVINVLSYLSYSYALLIAPKRDSFLKHELNT